MWTDSFRDRRVLITGGLGFIGSNLARRLVDLGAEVVLVDSLIPNHGGNRFNIAGIRDRVDLRDIDVRDTRKMDEIIEGVDFLFNLAGQTSHMDSMHDPLTDLAINCQAQLSLLESCRHRNPRVRIVFASTRQMYGRPDRLPVDETHLLRPVDVNGVNKMAGEWYHILYHHAYGIRACALRMGNTIGPRMRVKDDRQTFLGVWIRAAVEGRSFEVWGGEQKRDFTYVDDAVEALMLAALTDGAQGKAMNVGGLDVVTLRDLAALLVEIGGGSYTCRPFPEERKRIDIGSYYADSTLARRILGWRPAIGLREALERTVAYYRRYLPEYV